MGKPASGGARQGEKKLSWTYRNKKRQARNNRKEEDSNDNVQVQNKKARIVIRNLSFKATESDIRKLYEPFGQIEEINLLKRPDGKLNGCGFVQFKKVEDASKAIFNTNKKELLGRAISSAWAIPKFKYAEQIDKKSVTEEETEVHPDSATNEEHSANGEDDQADNEADVESKENGEAKESKKEHKTGSRRADRKVQKLLKQKKRARIVVRNLAFQVTEEALKEHFAKYGNIEEVKVLTRPDGKPLGCGFVQFELVQDAAKAIHYANMKPLLGRDIVVDRAMPKSKFDKTNETPEIKKEIEEIEIKDEYDDETKEEIEKKSIEANDEDDVEVKVEVKDEDSEVEEVGDTSFKEEEDEEDNGFLEEEPRRRVISNDVTEGRTVFLKNVPFAVRNEELRECMEQFGPVLYALVCMDPITEHTKGTAFVKFQNLDDAEKCLSAGTELRIRDQILDPHRALDRNTVQDTKALKKQKVKDSRNLYLVKEGVILAGSSAALGVSASDMAKRLQLEQWKSQMLRNLNMFVSRVRLVVHNLPPTLDDSLLRAIFKKHSGPKAVITEARVMRDLKNVDDKGVGKSKEFGFVAFTSHDDAIQALRSINNNPNIFSRAKRPIVAFSIENRVMVNAKKRRIDKSRERNPLWNREKTDENKERPPRKLTKISPPSAGADHEYSGVKSKIGEQKMRSKFNLKNQALLHNKVRKNEKKQLKEAKKLKAKKRDLQASRKEIKPKQGTKKPSAEEKNFNKLVNNYKSKLQAVPTTKSKWYDT